MSGWMDGWMDGWMGGWVDECMDGWMDVCMGGWVGCSIALLVKFACIIGKEMMYWKSIFDALIYW